MDHTRTAEVAPDVDEATADLPAAALGEALAMTDLPARDATDLMVALRAAVLGGRAACTFYGGHLEVAHKGSEGPVTEADHASNGAIMAYLAVASPDDPILSEESKRPDAARLGGRLWVVDPLDGTKEFIAANGEFSVMVGLAVGGRAVSGAVYQPAVGRVYVGRAQGGAWVVTEDGGQWTAAPLALDPTASLPHTLRFVRSRSHPDEKLARLAEKLGRIEEVTSGSVGIKCALVARGEADLYVHPVPFLKEWDTCAPEAILRGAGGKVTDCTGEPLRYGKEDPRQAGGIFAATTAAWAHARPQVTDSTRSLFENRDESETV